MQYIHFQITCVKKTLHQYFVTMYIYNLKDCRLSDFLIGWEMCTYTT